MSSYNTNTYEKADEVYRTALANYHANGLDNAASKAKSIASENADQAAQVATKNTLDATRSAGLSSSQSAKLAANKSADTTNTTYGNVYGTTLAMANQNEANYVNGLGQRTGNALKVDENKYAAENNRLSAILGGIGGVASGAASAMA